MTFTFAALAALLSPALVLFAIRRLVIPRAASSSLPLEFTADRYRPMFRLLDTGDIDFLCSQPGATPNMIKRLRRQRCQIFRGYLRCLERDFQLASAALAMVMMESPTERHDILRTLAVSRLKFSLGVLRVRSRLLLYRWNVGQEPLAQLVHLFEGLQLELLHGLQPAVSRAS